MSELAWFFRSLLRRKGWGVVLSVQAYFDESGTGHDELTVAGYLFEADRIEQFCEEWEGLLAPYQLPYFHMVDCAHGAPPFKHMNRDDRNRLQTALMKLIKRFSVNGIVCNVHNSRDNAGQRYLNAVKAAARLIIEWADRTAYSGRIAYFLESGANGQNLTDGWFHEIAGAPGSVDYYRYAGHAFVPKVGNPGVQAADLLSWQYHNFTKKRVDNNLARLDLRALLRHPHAYSDACGEPPRESEVQSIDQSRRRIETVHYLPTITEETHAGEQIIAPVTDFTPIRSDGSTFVLACPGCLRAIWDGASKGTIKNIAIRCWCGTVCKLPAALPPYCRY